MKKWVCPVCGYVHEGDTAPEKCPVCGVPGSKFKEQATERVWADEHKLGVAKGLDEKVVEGLRALDIPAFSVQYHPEAAAGPHDANYLFDRFADLVRSTLEASK